jgi:hypothetical protein
LYSIFLNFYMWIINLFWWILGTPLIPIQQQNGQTSGVQQQGTGQTLYRLPNSNQIVSIPSKLKLV